MKVTIECPAKINEFLAVGPKDSRGYHPLRTIFQAVSLFDTLVISDEAEFDSFSCNWELPGRNTVTKAWDLAREYARIPPLAVALEKRIPAQSGLGGGSSDAAGFLRALNRLLQHPIKEEDLFEIAEAVGADVPFFLVGGRARGEGYGELLISLPPLGGSHWIVLAQPDIACSTAEMYAKLDALDVNPFRAFPNDPGPFAFNEFVRVAPKECLELIEALRGEGCHPVGLTGSGSVVYAYAETKEQADSVAGSLSIWSTVVRPLDSNQNPERSAASCAQYHHSKLNT